MNKTSIPWTDFTWTVSRGCSPVSEGCRSCYAARLANRFAGPGGLYEGLAKGCKWTGEVKLCPENIGQPLERKKPAKIFVNSMSDLFHDRVPFEFIDRVFSVMAMADHHIFQVLTKRPERAAEWFDRSKPRGGFVPKLDLAIPWPLPNVWVGVTAEDQEMANKRIPALLRIPAAKRFVSIEPMLSQINLRLPTKTWAFRSNGGLGCAHCCNGDRCDDPSHWYRPECPYCRGTGLGQPIDQVILGCESGPGARRFDVDWARSVRDQCVDSKTAYFYKSGPDEHGKIVSMPKLDGVVWDQFPETK